VGFAPDLHANLATGDGFEQMATHAIDQYIDAAGIDAPPEELPHLRDGFEQPLIESLDLRSAGISTVVWATGFTFDYHLIRLPVTDSDGLPMTDEGISRYPGLSFVGMPWMPSERAGFLIGVGDRAEQIAARIVEGSRATVA
jgi:putative flavoprotein involved in K+ transport